MADNGSDNDSTKPKSVDLSKLKTSVNLGEPLNADFGQLAGVSKVVAAFQKQMALPKSMMDSVTSISDMYSPNSALSSVSKMIAEQGSVFSALQKSALGSDMSGIFALQDRMKALSGAYPPNSALSSVSKMIAEQGNAVSALQKAVLENDMSGTLGSVVSDNEMYDSPSSIPTKIDFPKNPILETNQRLKRIENQFEKMQGIALSGAEIATELQASAAEFLGKFETAANANTQSAKHVIRLGVFAVIFAFTMPAIQIAYSELWRGPQEALAARETIAELKAEVTAMVEAQVLVTERLIEALASSDRDTAAALLEIGNILTQQQAAIQNKAE